MEVFSDGIPKNMEELKQKLIDAIKNINDNHQDLIIKAMRNFLVSWEIITNLTFSILDYILLLHEKFFVHHFKKDSIRQDCCSLEILLKSLGFFRNDVKDALIRTAIRSKMSLWVLLPSSMLHFMSATEKRQTNYFFLEKFVNINNSLVPLFSASCDVYSGKIRNGIK